jgi:DNA-binding IclR family transcriptional regulator
MLADLPFSQVRALFPDPDAFVDRHGVGPTSLTALRRLLSDARRSGHAGEDGEVTPGFASVAAAAHDHTGRPVAGVAVTFGAGDVEGSGREALARTVTAAATELTRRVGGVAPR